MEVCQAVALRCLVGWLYSPPAGRPGGGGLAYERGASLLGVAVAWLGRGTNAQMLICRGRAEPVALRGEVGGPVDGAAVCPG
jgi:hypothetical protein